MFAKLTWCGPLAQLAEQLTLNQPVGGSSPPRLRFKRGEGEADYWSTSLVEYSQNMPLGSALELYRSPPVKDADFGGNRFMATFDRR